MRVYDFFFVGASRLNEFELLFFALNHEAHVQHAALTFDLKRLTHV